MNYMKIITKLNELRLSAGVRALTKEESVQLQTLQENIHEIFREKMDLEMKIENAKSNFLLEKGRFISPEHALRVIGLDKDGISILEKDKEKKEGHEH